VAGFGVIPGFVYAVNRMSLCRINFMANRCATPLRFRNFEQEDAEDAENSEEKSLFTFACFARAV
jgi:hypothetical protein